MLTDEDLEESCDRLKIPLVGIFSKDLLPKHCIPGGYIINLQNHDEGHGSHWVALAVRADSALYFDSFGMPPPLQVIRFVRDDYTLVYNKQDIQNIDSGVCGSYCLAFLYYILVRDGSLRLFQHLFSPDPRKNRGILQDILAPL